MEHPDVLLWAVWALQQYAKETSREQCRQKYGELLKDIMEFIRQRKHENLFLHDNGLLFANGTDKAITWMNSTVNGHPVIPRTGYIVEFNALWYNALRFIADLVREGCDLAAYLTMEADPAGMIGLCHPHALVSLSEDIQNSHTASDCLLSQSRQCCK